MNKLLAGLFAGLFATSVVAEDIWEAGNHGGGKIVLTSDDCVVDGQKYAQFFAARTWDASGFKADGCWTISRDNAGHVRIVWAVDPVVVLDYPVQLFSRIGKESPADAKNRI